MDAHLDSGERLRKKEDLTRKKVDFMGFSMG